MGHEELRNLQMGSAVQDEDSDRDDDPRKRYIQTLIRTDTGNLGLGNNSANHERAQRLLTWIATRDADAVFLVSHGGFLMFVDALACGSSRVRALWRGVSGRAYMQNCEVRRYKIRCGLPSPGWALSHWEDDETLSSSTSSRSMITSSGTSSSEYETSASSSFEFQLCCVGRRVKR